MGLMSNIRRAILLIVLMAIVFVWGALTVREQVFPFQYLNKYLENGAPVSLAVESGSAQAKAGKKDDRREQDRLWADRLTQGGYILHFRHAQREKWKNVHAFDIYEIHSNVDGSTMSFSKAVCLSAQGTEEARLIKWLFDSQSVRISQVISSPSCRAKQTAMLAFGRLDSINTSLLHRSAMVDAQRGIFAKELRSVIDKIEITPGYNVVLSGHGDTLKHDGAIVIDEDRTGGIDTRDETGFVVIEKKDGMIIAHHAFKDIKAYATAVVELPVR